MIGQLRGVLLHKAPPQLLIDVHGVGYEVEAPMSTFYRRLFRLLIKVSGIGARLALGVLSGISSDDFALCVERGDTAALTRLPGIGKKTAERLIVEMRDRLQSPLGGDGGLPGGVERAASPSEEALQALVSLGYRESDAARMIKQVAAPDLDTETLIRKALQNTVKK